VVLFCLLPRLDRQLKESGRSRFSLNALFLGGTSISCLSGPWRARPRIGSRISRSLPTTFLSVVLPKVALLSSLFGPEEVGSARPPLSLVPPLESSIGSSRVVSLSAGLYSPGMLDLDGPSSLERSGPSSNDGSRVEGPAWVLRLPSVPVCRTRLAAFSSSPCRKVLPLVAVWTDS